jgi:hypothetical protein
MAMRRRCSSGRSGAIAVRADEQVRNVVSDDGVEVVGADRLVAADPAAFVA